MKRTLSDAAAVAFLTALAAFYHWPELIGESAAVFVDASRLFFPYWKWSASIWRDGVIPLWFPLHSAGHPFFADPQSVAAYPPFVLLHLILSPLANFNWQTFLHHVLALVGAYALVRRRSGGVVPALFGAVVFGFALHVVCMSWCATALFTVAWMPWAFIAFARMRDGARGGWAVLALVLALQLAAGYPVFFYLTVLALLVENAAASGKWEDLWRWLPPFTLAVALSVALNAVWLLPFLEMLQGTDLGAGKYYQPLGLRELSTILSPFALGHPLERGYTGPHYWVASYYMGIPAVAVALWGVFTGRVRRSAAWILLLYVVLSLGETLVLGGILKRILPGYGFVIRSGFLLPLVAFQTCLVCAEALDPSGREEKGFQTAGIWCGIGLIVYGIAAWLGVRDVRFFLSDAVLFLLAGCAGGWRRSLPGRPVLALLALLLSLLPAAVSLRFLLPVAYYETLPVLLTSMDRPGRMFHSPLVLKRSGVLTGKTPEDAYYRSKEWMYPDWPMTFGRSHIQGYNTLGLRPTREWLDNALRISPSFTRKVLDYLNVRYLLGKNDLPGLLPVRGAVAGVEAYENPTALPLWYSVTRAYPAGVASVDMERNAESFFDFSMGCFIEDARKAGAYVPCRVLELKRTPNSVELLVQGAPSTSRPEAGKILIVSSEAAYPGWVFKNDWGKREPLETVNHVFRGAILDPGVMHARITYEPVTFRLGLFLTLLVLGGLLVPGLSSRLLGRRP